MFKAPDLSILLERFAIWFNKNFWTVDFFFESIIVIAAFLLGALAYRLSLAKITQAIENAPFPMRVKINLNHLKRLVLPIATLIFMFLGAMIASAEIFGIHIAFVQGVMKVLLAWIFIRGALQFVTNGMVRSFLAVTIWTMAALSLLGILDETTTTLDAFGFSIGTFRLSALAVIKGIFSLFILLYVAIFLSTMLERQVLRARSLTRSSQVLLAKIIRIALIVFAVLIGITSAGIDLSIFTVFSGAVGLGVGFGLQKVVSNLFSGLLLLMDKSITPGDVIELENSGTFGWVNHMGARYTEIITRDNKSYLIPNEEFVTQNVVNWSHGSKLIRLKVEFSVHYSCNPHEVLEIAKKAATRPARVAEEPQAQCWITEFGERGINFTLRFWIKDAEAGVNNVRGEVYLALWDAFKEHGIQIPYPHREVFVHTTNEKPAPAAAPRKKS